MCRKRILEDVIHFLRVTKNRRVKIVLSALKSAVDAKAMFLYLSMAASTSCAAIPSPREPPLLFEDYGAIGDGIYDDTRSVGSALKECSTKNGTITLKEKAEYRITRPLYLWGGCNISGGAHAKIVMDLDGERYLIHVGISGKNRLEEPYFGMIEGVEFVVRTNTLSRLLFFWRTDGARIENNSFFFENGKTSATSSGNDNEWVVNGNKNCIRKNIRILNNKIVAVSKDKGSEGVGLASFNGAEISGNHIVGVGDDPIGIHYSSNIEIYDNDLSSVDGRIFVSNSQNIKIGRNTHRRMASGDNGVFYKGISLVYIGYESAMYSDEFFPSSEIDVFENRLIYPSGAIDAGAAIYLYGLRNARVFENIVENNSESVTASGVHVLPMRLKKSQIELKDSPPLVTKVGRLSVTDNVFIGTHPLKIIMTGNCQNYIGPVVFSDNMAAEKKMYCPSKVYLEKH